MRLALPANNLRVSFRVKSLEKVVALFLKNKKLELFQSFFTFTSCRIKSFLWLRNKGRATLRYGQYSQGIKKKQAKRWGSSLRAVVPKKKKKEKTYERAYTFGTPVPKVVPKEPEVWPKNLGRKFDLFTSLAPKATKITCLYRYSDLKIAANINRSLPQVKRVKAKESTVIQKINYPEVYFSTLRQESTYFNRAFLIKKPWKTKRFENRKFREKKYRIVVAGIHARRLHRLFLRFAAYLTSFRKALNVEPSKEIEQSPNYAYKLFSVASNRNVKIKLLGQKKVFALAPAGSAYLDLLKSTKLESCLLVGRYFTQLASKLSSLYGTFFNLHWKFGFSSRFKKVYHTLYSRWSKEIPFRLITGPFTYFLSYFIYFLFFKDMDLFLGQLIKLTKALYLRVFWTFSRMLKNISILSFGLVGVRFQLTGKFNNRPRKRKVIFKQGLLPYQNRNYTLVKAQRSFVGPRGAYGLKVWLLYKNV